MRRGVTTRRQRPRRAPGRGRPCGALAKPVFRWGAGSLATENRKREGGAAWRFREPGLASEACVGNQGKVDDCSTKALLLLFTTVLQPGLLLLLFSLEYCSPDSGD